MSEDFFQWLKGWFEELAPVKIDQIIETAGGPENVAIICVDAINGFCKEGPLASPRVGSIVSPIVDLFTMAWDKGVRLFVLPQDAHPADSPEFDAWGPHAIAGTKEAETVDELKELPFSHYFQVIEKQNLNPGLMPELAKWLDDHGNVRQYIVVGDCTDLCIYQMAMFLRARANQLKFDYGVIVPEDCVDTFDISVEVASKLGIHPHDADLLHRLFLYHMEMNDIIIVSEFTD